jgi:tRNA(Ile)-lysidine synthase
MRRNDFPDIVTMLRAEVSRALAEDAPAGAPLVLAFSGGRDSSVLLDILAALGPAHGRVVTAVHVHHGLSPNADTWVRFCQERCASLAITCDIRHVDVPRHPQTSLEAEARRMRYAALAAAAADAGARHVLLAHHRDDQAETLLLQLLRGAGSHGLAGMARTRTDVHGVNWLRPLLGCSRADIDAYARAANLSWHDDESNDDSRHLRNALRHTVLPQLAQVFPGHALTLARAAEHQADAAQLADDLAAIDAMRVGDPAALNCAALAALPPYRARNLLRWFLRQRGLPAPPSARLAAMLDQLSVARCDASIRLPHAGVEIGVHRGQVMLHAPDPPQFDVPWQGEPEVELPHGTLAFVRVEGSGIDMDRLAADVRVRSRAGGERFQLAADRPRRALKAILREAGIPPWERRGLPLVFCGGALAAVPGLGIDAALRAAPGQPGMSVEWQPHIDLPQSSTPAGVDNPGAG